MGLPIISMVIIQLVIEILVNMTIFVGHIGFIWIYVIRNDGFMVNQLEVSKEKILWIYPWIIHGDYLIIDILVGGLEPWNFE